MRVTSTSKRPSADANIDDLHAWAARENKAASKAAPSGDITSTRFSSVPATDRGEAAGWSGLGGGSLLPKVLLVLGAGVAAYLVFSFVIGLLMTLLMIAGGVALLYAVFRIGRWRGRGE